MDEQPTVQHLFRKGLARPLDPYPSDLLLVLDGVYDAFNVGALFRLAEAVTARILACGKTTLPPDRNITKSSMGFCEYVPWTYQEDIGAALRDLRSRGWQVTALETGGPAFDGEPWIRPAAVVVGNESYGLSDPALAAADRRVSIPMYGQNPSLNVAVAAGLVLYHARRSMGAGG